MKRHTTGAYMASAAEKRPKRNGPPVPWRSRQLCQSDWMRSISSLTSAGQVRRAKALRTFIDRFWRSAGKPECISAHTDRAVARARKNAAEVDGRDRLERRGLDGKRECSARNAVHLHRIVVVARHELPARLPFHRPGAEEGKTVG